MNTMQTNEQVIEILNDLIKVNNDRIAGYERAKTEAHDLDVDLKAIFDGMIRESHEYKQELTEKITSMGGLVEEGTTTAGMIYRAWMDLKSTFTGTDRTSILESCAFGEDAAQRAYNSALDSLASFGSDMNEMIIDQQNSLIISHALIKKYMDAHHALH